jgi:hypothetical protein
MSSFAESAARFLAVSTVLLLTACGGGGGGGGGAPGSNQPPPGQPTGQYTIGGVVQGLEGTGLAIWGNGIPRFDIASNGSFTIPRNFSSGQAYQVVMYAHPTSPIQECNVTNGSGTIGSANVIDIVVDCRRVPARYNNGRNWNNYVLNDGPSFLESTGRICDITQNGGYSACLHAGEIREFELTGVSSCAGLRIRDQLSAFDWVCEASAPYAKVVSRGLKPNRGLSDLIDFGQVGWRSNFVTASNGVTDVFSTPPQVWWNNPIVRLTGGTTLSGLHSGTIFVMTSSITSGQPLSVGGDSLALVMGPGVSFTFAPATNDLCAIAASNRSFAWIEGEIKSARCGVSLGFRSVLSSSRIVGPGVNATNPYEGILIWSGNDNLIRNVQIANFPTGVNNYFSQRNTFFNIGIQNANLGFDFYQSRNHVMSGVTMVDVTTRTDFGDTSSYSNRLLNSSVASWSGTPASVVYSTLLNDVFINAQTVVHDAQSEAPFVGRVMTDDSANQSDNNAADQLGPGLSSYQNIADWFRFENEFRGWGSSGSVSPACRNNTTCQIWDLSLRTSDTTIRDVMAIPNGNDITTHSWDVSNSVDPQARCGGIVGANWDSNAQICTTTFLANAVEILGDMVGNEDGFCQSNERCLYTPNIASYQGHGELVELGAFVDGTIRGVLLYGYSVNGR